MTTFTSLQAATTYPIKAPIGAGIKCVSWGTIAVAVNPVAADIYEMCWLPAGCTVVDGLVRAGDMDTNATETLDMDLGWAANGGSGTYDAADPDGFGNYGVWIGDAAYPNLSPVAGNVFTLAGAFLGLGIFPTFTNKTKVQFVCIATAATFTAGQLSCQIGYTMP